MNNSFKNFPFNEKIQAVLEKLGFVEPTEIQQCAIPLLMEKQAVDIHGQAQTGTGKTLAFGLPLVHRIDVSNKATQALVVAPTRELAVQICESLQPFANALGISIKTIYGGASMDEQVRALRKGVQLVVGTPGRVNDHIRRKVMNLDQLKTLVLDEADIMLDMGFREEVEEIIKYANKSREIWLFSATVKAGIRALMSQHMKNTVSVAATKQKSSVPTIKQFYCMLPSKARITALCRFIESAPEFYGFIFCQTKILTSEVADSLRRFGYHVGCLHGDMSQEQRNAVLRKFKARDFMIVVATDVAARGLDVQDLTHVINYSLPEDHESYVHRTGRTGRAGKEGIAITFTGKHDLRTISMIQRKYNIIVDPIAVPSRDDIILKRMAKASEYLDSLISIQKTKESHQSVIDLVSKFDETQLRTLAMRFVHDKFLDSILKEDEALFNTSASGSYTGSNAHSASRSGSHGDILTNRQEIMFSVGTDDDMSQDEFTEFLLTSGGIKKDDIQKIRVLRRRTYLEVVPEVAMRLLEATRNATFGGRQVRPQFVEEQSFSGSGRNSGGRSGGGSRSGGSDRSRSGGDRNRGGGDRNRSGGDRSRSGGSSSYSRGSSDEGSWSRR